MKNAFNSISGDDIFNLSGKDQRGVYSQRLPAAKRLHQTLWGLNDYIIEKILQPYYRDPLLDLSWPEN